MCVTFFVCVSRHCLLSCQTVQGPPVPRDMKYNMFNIDRQRKNFDSIRSIAGKDLINDLYARDPDSDTFWFIGKVARVSGKHTSFFVSMAWLSELQTCEIHDFSLSHFMPV